MDAPATRAAALVMAPGSYTGALDFANGDRADWYAYTAGPATLVHINVASLNNSNFELRVDLYIDGAFTAGFWLGGFGQDFLVPAGSTIAWDVSDSWDSVAAPYAFDVAAHDIPDLAVSNLRVESTPNMTAPNDMVVTRDFVVSFDVTNSGIATASGADVSLVARTSKGSRTLAAERINLAPGQSKHYSAPWNRLGEVGHVDVVATISHPWDPSPADNSETSPQFVLVDSNLVSADAGPASLNLRSGSFQAPTGVAGIGLLGGYSLGDGTDSAWFDTGGFTVRAYGHADTTPGERRLDAQVCGGSFQSPTCVG